MIIDINDTFNRLTNNVMCSKSCSCTSLNTKLWKSHGYDITGAVMDGSNTQVSSCVDYTLFDTEVIEIMSVLEKKHNCSGICSPMKYFLFSDVTM